MGVLWRIVAAFSIINLVRAPCQKAHRGMNRLPRCKIDGPLPRGGQKKMVNTRVELATLALLAPRSNQLS